MSDFSQQALLDRPAKHNLRDFARDILTSLRRADQRRWAEIYLRGLLALEGKKSIRRMVDGVVDLDPQAASQSLQQFINQSPWSWDPIRESLARHIQDGLRPKAWVVDEAVIPKRGKHSVGVDRRFFSTEGRTINCQLGTALLFAGDFGAAPVDWSLELTGGWLNDNSRRWRAKIPNAAVPKGLSERIFEMTDRLVTEWQLPVAPLVANLSDNNLETGRLISGLTDRNMDFLVEVSGSLEVISGSHLAAVHPGTPIDRTDDGRGRVVTAQDCISGGRGSRMGATVLTAAGGRPQRLRLQSSLIRLPGVRAPRRGPHPVYRLFAEWSPSDGRATRFWVTNLLHRRLDEVAQLDAFRPQGCLALRQLADEFGLKDFEGRSYPGWHHHMTLVSAAYGYHKLHSLTTESRFDCG